MAASWLLSFKRKILTSLNNCLIVKNIFCFPNTAKDRFEEALERTKEEAELAEAGSEDAKYYNEIGITVRYNLGRVQEALCQVWPIMHFSVCFPSLNPRALLTTGTAK